MFPTIEKWRLICRTLRFRLAAWNALVVVLTALVTLAGLRQGVRWTLLHEMDQILIEDAGEIRLMLESTGTSSPAPLFGDLERKATGHRHHGWFVQLLDARGATLWSTADAPADLQLPATSGDSFPRTAGNNRIVQTDARASSSAVAAIRVGASLDFLAADMARLDRLVIVAAAAVLIAAPLCGYWLAGRAARTVGAIIDSASRLRPNRLEERLPVRGTGDELDQLAATVNSLLDRIATYLDEKRDLLANAAHELRTPLAAIRSSVEVALSGERSREEYEELLVEVIDQSAALETLVNQLLLLSETEADRLKLDGRPVLFHEVVQRAVDMFQGVAESRGLALRLTRLEETMLVGNRLHLRQVVNNLVDNAVKYTPQGGWIEVELGRVDDRSARLTVQDSGPGIAERDLAHIFERFFRGDRSRTRDGSAPGTGLGLSICRAVVEAHGGQITCVSRPGMGTAMIVELPLASSARLLADAGTGPAPSLAGRTDAAGYED